MRSTLRLQAGNGSSKAQGIRSAVKTPVAPLGRSTHNPISPQKGQKYLSSDAQAMGNYFRYDRKRRRSLQWLEQINSSPLIDSGQAEDYESHRQDTGRHHWPRCAILAMDRGRPRRGTLGRKHAGEWPPRKTPLAPDRWAQATDYEKTF